jgi:hypothetical protein
MATGGELKSFVESFVQQAFPHQIAFQTGVSIICYELPYAHSLLPSSTGQPSLTQYLTTQLIARVNSLTIDQRFLCGTWRCGIHLVPTLKSLELLARYFPSTTFPSALCSFYPHLGRLSRTHLHQLPLHSLHTLLTSDSSTYSLTICQCLLSYQYSVARCSAELNQLDRVGPHLRLSRIPPSSTPSTQSARSTHVWQLNR